MYQVNKNTKVDSALIQNAINYNEKLRDRYDLLDRYYIGRQAITERKKPEDGGLMNNKVMVNHAKYIVDVATGYLLGNPVDYQVAKDGEDIEPILGAFKRQSIENMDVDLAKDCSIFGRTYEYIYADEEANPCSTPLDPRNTIIIYDDSLAHRKLFGVNYRPVFTKKDDSEPDHYDVLIASKNEVINATLKKNSLNILDVHQHAFGDVPIIEYKNNSELQGDFEPVISLIDAYNLIQSDRVNDREQLVDAILCFYGMDFDQAQMEMLKSQRALASIPTDGKVEYLTKQVNEADVDVLRKTIEQDIHKISMIPNMSDENFVGNSSGVALRYKLLTFEQAVKNKERFFEQSLKERFRLYNNFLAMKSAMQLIPLEDIDAVFKRNLPSNDYETSQMILNLHGVVDDELLVSQLSFVKDASETVQTAKEAKEENMAKFGLYAGNDFGDKNKEDKEEDEE